MLGLRKKCGYSTLNWPLRFHEIIPFVDAEQATFSTFSFFIVFSPHVRSVLLVRAATAVERRSTGLQPIIRKEKGMNRKASFHWEMPKYRHIMDTEAEAEAGRRGDINWRCCSLVLCWTHRMMAERHYTAPTVSLQLQACTDKQKSKCSCSCRCTNMQTSVW